MKALNLTALSLVLALPSAWMSVEALRSLLPLPIGAPWLRLGHHAHHHLWLSGSARVWGLEAKHKPMNLRGMCWPKT